MKLQWTKVFWLSCCAMILASCSYKRSADPAAINDANQAYRSAEARGLGGETRFGEEGGMRTASRSKRTYYFDFDSNVIHDGDKPAIRANANYFTTHPSAVVLVEGHTDPRGSREYNIGLGERRARSVAEYLAANGVNPKQIRVVSYGAEKLANPGHTEAAYQLDRRVNLVYMRS